MQHLYIFIISFTLASCKHISIFNEDHHFNHQLKHLQSSTRSLTHDVLFEKFLTLFNRTYQEDWREKEKRKTVFKDSLKRHLHLNNREKANNGTAMYGINKFSDWTPQEFQSILLQRHMKSERAPWLNEINFGSHPDCSVYHQNIPDSIDWKKKLTRIKDQKSCGSCWAFVASEQVETYKALKGYPLVELSPQELLSCAPSLGCEGGNTCYALSWMLKNNISLETEEEYPYVEKKAKCKYNNRTTSNARVKTVCGCASLVDREDIMLLALAQKGPMSVNVDAVLWHDYIGGIIQHHCSNNHMNHAVQLVGYNLKHEPIPYWLARNQWGRSFGEDGYLRIKYGSNMCGIAEQPSFIVV